MKIRDICYNSMSNLAFVARAQNYVKGVEFSIKHLLSIG